VKVRVSVESADKKSFATAVDWPGWSRSGKTEELAIESLISYADRYAPIAKAAGEAFTPTAMDVAVVEHVTGGGATEFGVPEQVTKQDRRRTTAADGKRLAALVESAWKAFDRIANASPEELRKGPRGGGRNTSKIVEHVFGAEQGYARVMGIKRKEFPTTDRPTHDELRAEMLDILRAPSDGSPLASKKWTARYAAHRVAWHALDHAWEIEDRSDPAD
jgi:hypothetical protein